jgi:hypothetical protein
MSEDMEQGGKEPSFDPDETRFDPDWKRPQPEASTGKSTGKSICFEVPIFLPSAVVC